MSYKFISLSKEYNQELLELSRLTTTGSDDFIVNRSPDFFALSEEFGDIYYFGLKNGNKLIGCVGVIKQKRIIAGKNLDTYYIHDLRVHPEYQGTNAYFRLMENVRCYLEQETSWGFSTILDSNHKKETIINGRSLLPNGKIIGVTVHVGIPMFRKVKAPAKVIKEISADAAWDFYSREIKQTNFALIDEAVYKRNNGTYLAVIEEGRIAAICEVINQSKSRKLISTKRKPIHFQFINLICKARGIPPLPGKGEEFKHTYLSYYVTSNSNDYRKAFLTYINTHFDDFTYVFIGLPKHDVHKFRNLFNITLTSTTYGYGAIPKDARNDFHELTLI